MGKKLRNGEKFAEALQFYEEIWETEKNEWNGFYLAQCLRKTGDYANARALHIELAADYPHSKPIIHERLWFGFYRYIFLPKCIGEIFEFFVFFKILPILV